MPKLSKKNEYDEKINCGYSRKGSKRSKGSKGSKKTTTKSTSKKTLKTKQSAGSYVGHNPNIEKINNEDQKCAPGVKFEQGTCFILEQLIDMANAYNVWILMKLVQNKDSINVSNSKIDLLKQLTDRLRDTCDDQLCWIKQSFMDYAVNREQIVNETFRPTGPQGRFTWLNTTNINDVMTQYHKKYKDFKFLGTVPLDFDKFPQLGFININFNNLLNNGIKKIGTVFNLDYHFQSGSHWVAMYADLEQGNIYYFDSYGKPPEYEIKKFIKRIANWYIKKNKLNIEVEDTETFMINANKKNNVENCEDMDVRYNTNRHQYKNSECGVYSMNFILRLLKGETFNEINSQKLPDDDVNKCREVYFTY